MYDLLALSPYLHNYTLKLLHALLGASLSGGYLLVQPNPLVGPSRCLVVQPLVLTNYKSPRLTVTISRVNLSDVIVDGGSGINLMPEYTLHQLGLQIHQPTPFLVNMADLCSIPPLDLVQVVPISIQGDIFQLDFVVIKFPYSSSSFLLLLGCPWLRQAKAIHEWGMDQIWISTPTSSQVEVILKVGWIHKLHLG